MPLADAVVAQVEDNFCVDTNRIFANGVELRRRACPTRRRARGRSAGPRPGSSAPSPSTPGAQLSGNCTPSKPVAYYASHGTHDSVLNYSGGVPLAQNFATANGCTWTTPTKVTSGDHVCTKLTGCMAGYPVEFCSFNGDHTPYPDNGQRRQLGTSRSLDVPQPVLMSASV